MRIASLVFGLTVIAAPALAEDPAPSAAPAPPTAVPGSETAPVPPARFVFERAGDGFVRLDRDTGQVASCQQDGKAWACQAAAENRPAIEAEKRAAAALAAADAEKKVLAAAEADRRAALEQEIGRLRNEVAALRLDLNRTQIDLSKAQEREKERTEAVARADEPPRPPADLTPSPDGRAPSALRLPTQQDVDRAAVVMRHAWDRVVSMIGDIKRDLSRKIEPKRPPEQTTL